MDARVKPAHDEPEAPTIGARAANRKWNVAALSTARRILRALEKARSAIGVRLIASFPPAGPAHLGTRVFARAPGSGSPVPACAGRLSMSQRFRQQKTLRSSGSGGSANEQTVGPAFRQNPSH